MQIGGALLLLAATTAGNAVAQSVPTLEIISAQHDPRGLITASVASSDAEAFVLGKLLVFVDGVPGRLVAPPLAQVDPVSVVALIDASGSMAGAPLAAAQAATLDLIDGLKPDDRVALLAFADAPVVLSPLSTDRSLLGDAVRSLTAAGDTALYDAVEAAAQLLASVDDGPRAIVLLSDGRDSGRVSTVGRAESLATLSDSGAFVYAFALGGEADADYLGALSGATGGGLWEVADSDALASLFADLGRRLGATYTLGIEVPPLAAGRHELTLRALGESDPAEATYPLEVVNEGLIRAVASSPDGGSTLAVGVEALVPLSALSIEAVADGRPLPFDRGSARVTIDPWLFDAGTLEVEVIALVDGKAAARVTVVVEVPSLAPQLDIGLYAEAGDPRRAVIGRAQGVDRPLLRVFADGVELPPVRAEGAQVVTVVEAQREIVAHLESADGQPLLSRSLTIDPPAASAGGLGMVLTLAVLAAGVAVAVFVARGARSQKPWLRNR